MSEPKCLLLVGKVRPERKRSLTGMAVAANLPLVAIEDPALALEWLDANDPGCLLVDAGVGRLDKLIARLRSKRHLAHVPVLALVSAPDDLWIEQYFGWGGDDVVQVDAGSTLLDRLRAVPREPPQSNPSRHVLIGDPDKTRPEVIGRTFAQAGFDVMSAIDRKSLERCVEQHNPQLIIANCILGELPDLIARTRQNGSTATWIIMAARRELEAQQLALGAVDRCSVMGIQANPWQILYRANELSRAAADERRRELRRPFGSFVLFRTAGSDDDDVGVAYNLNSRGMFIRTFAPVLSEDVWLEWRVPQDKTRVRLEGRVVWRQTSLTEAGRAASPLGFGVEFCDYLGGARKHLERALEVLDAGAKRSSAPNPVAAPVGSPASDPTNELPVVVSDSLAPMDAGGGSIAAARSAGETQVRAGEASANGKAEIAPVKAVAARPIPAAGKTATPKTEAVGLPAARPAQSQSSTPGTTRISPSVRPLSNLGGSSKTTPSVKPMASVTPGAAVSPTAAARPTGSDRPTAAARPTASDRPTAAAKPTGSDRPTAAAMSTASDRPTAAAAKPTASDRPTAVAAKPTGSDRPTALIAKPTASVSPDASAKAQPLGKETSKAISIGTSERSELAVSQAVTKRAAVAPLARSGVKPPINVMAPRPVGAPPRPNRPPGANAIPLGPAKVAAGLADLAVTAVDAELSESSASKNASDQVDGLRERRFDTLRNAMVFDDPVENTDPDAGRELLEEGPTSSEQTEILANPTALFEGVEESRHPLYHSSDDAPTVVTDSPTTLSQRMMDIGTTQDEVPPSARVADSFFEAEEHVTQQWHAEAAQVDLQHEADDQGLLPKRRRGGVVLVVSFVVVAAALAGVGLWLRASGAGHAAQSTRLPSANASNFAAASAIEQPVASASAAAQALTDAGAIDAGAIDAAAPEASATADAGGIPWARRDDGTGLENFPPVEDPQGGKGRLLADRYGYLVVRFPEAAYLFADNIAVGATNWKIAFPCGERTLRIGVGEKPVTWLSSEARVNVACRDVTRVVFERLPGVVAPPGVVRPIAPGSMPSRKSSEKTSERPSTESASAPEPDKALEKKQTDPYGLGNKPESGSKTEGERGVVDTRE